MIHLICWSDISLYLKIGGGYLLVSSCCSCTPCDRKKDLNSRALLCLLSDISSGCLLEDADTKGGILVHPLSVEGPDIRRLIVHMLVSSVFLSHSVQCSFFVDRMRLAYILHWSLYSLWLRCCRLLLTLFASLVACLMLECAWDRSFVHHILEYGEEVVSGTVAATAVLIAVVKLVSLGSKSLGVRISVGAGSIASCSESCFWNLSQLNCCQFNFGWSELCAIEVLSVVIIGKGSMHGDCRLGRVMHCVMRSLIVSLQNRLPGHVRFLVCVVCKVGMSLGSDIIMLKSASRSNKI